LLLLIASVLAIERPSIPKTDVEIEQAFEDFIVQYGKMYALDAKQEHFAIFKENLVKIEALNARNTRAVFGITKFSDMSTEEFKKYYLNSKPAIRPENVPVAPLASVESINALPKSFDWRPKGAVTAVKNQGQCGSCWSFSATGNIEGQWFLAGHSNNGEIVGLSEQNLVDCDHQCRMYENQQSCDAGCEGGLQPNAFTYVIKNQGIDTEASYPYTAEDGTCHYSAANKGAQISNWTFVSQNEDQMAAYLVAHGPLAIAADAEEWQFYIWGVFEGPCGTSLDHGILIVGFGEETDELGFNIKYWIVKNSWGADWGLSGYLWIIRGVGECGLNLYVSSSIV